MIFNWKSEYSRYHHYFFNLQKKTQTPKARSFAWLSLSIFTVSFFIIMAIKPTLVTIAKLNREIKDKKEASLKLQEKINSIIAAQQEFSANVDNLYLIGEALPEKSEFPRLANFFEQTASVNEVTLQSLNFEKIGDSKTTPANNPSTLHSLNFSLGISGDYFKLRNFLNTLESSRRIVKIQRVSFNRFKKENTFELLLLVSGTAFFD